MEIKRSPIISLDHALKLWEDYQFITKMQILLQTCGMLDLGSLGPVAHGEDFRQYLLDAREESRFDSVRFGVRRDTLEKMARTNQPAGTLLVNQQLQAEAIFRWTRHSRRAFHLSNDLSLLLQHTSLHTLTWREVGWPFEAFAIVFDTPVRCGSWEIDCCVVHPCDIPGDNGRWITGFDLRIREWPGMSHGRRKMYMRDIANNDWEQVAANAKADFDAIKTQQLHALTLPIGRDDDRIAASGRLYTQHLRKQGLEAPHSGDMEPLYRVVGGLGQYLKSLPSGSPHISRSEKIARTRDLDRRSIIAEADVATVSSYYTLTGEEREILEDILRGPSGRQLCAHWRRGHWRKHAGMGGVPDAPKTVWVRPTLVRTDRLADGTLPGGCTTSVELPGTEE